jgi:hypothetical protein
MIARKEMYHLVKLFISKIKSTGICDVNVPFNTSYVQKPVIERQVRISTLASFTSVTLFRLTM